MRAALAEARRAFAEMNSLKHSEVLARAAKCEARKPLPAHCTFDAHNRLTACRCKLCGAGVSGLQPLDEMRETLRDGQRIVIFERVSMARFANYDELVIVFDDGSAHATAICKTCKKKLLGQQDEDIVDELEWMYQADVRAMTQESKSNALEINWMPWANRKPVGVQR